MLILFVVMNSYIRTVNLNFCTEKDTTSLSVLNKYIRYLKKGYSDNDFSSSYMKNVSDVMLYLESRGINIDRYFEEY